MSTHNHRIWFRHPGYDDSANILFRLLAPMPGTSSVGLDTQVALNACGIIAGNRWDGWLSEVRDPILARGTAAIIDPSGTLTKDSYYFHLPAHPDERDLPYAVVPTFQQWRFPHEKLPELWTRIAPPPPKPVTSVHYTPSNLSNALRERDGSCRVSGWVDGAQVAHLCPKQADRWWRRNGMARYNMSSSSNSNDPANTLLLRADLHALFDRAMFVFVPRVMADSENAQLGFHLLEPAENLEVSYHGHVLQAVRACTEMLFARFAWAILPLIKPFLMGEQRRRVITMAENSASTDKDGFVSPEGCASLFSSKESRGAKKRKADDASDADETESSCLDDELRPRKKLRVSTRHVSVQDSFPTSDSLSLSSRSSVTNASSSTSKSSPALDGEVDGNGTLAQTWLAQERLRSDPDGQWKRDQAWAQRMSQGEIVMTAAEAKKYMEIM